MDRGYPTLSPIADSYTWALVEVDAMKMNGVEEYDIPAFLRKQAD